LDLPQLSVELADGLFDLLETTKSNPNPPL